MTTPIQSPSFSSSGAYEAVPTRRRATPHVSRSPFLMLCTRCGGDVTNNDPLSRYPGIVASIWRHATGSMRCRVCFTEVFKLEACLGINHSHWSDITFPAFLQRKPKFPSQSISLPKAQLLFNRRFSRFPLLAVNSRTAIWLTP
jgi:hypothetical protein